MGDHAITLNLDDKHNAALEEMAKVQGMSKSAVLRQSLRMYQLILDRIHKGERLAFTKDGKIVPQLIVGLGDIE